MSCHDVIDDPDGSMEIIRSFACPHTEDQILCNHDRSRPTHTANYSDERRATAISWIRGQMPADLDHDAQLIAAIGLLICDETGFVANAHLDSAMHDITVIQAAETLLREARSA